MSRACGERRRAATHRSVLGWLTAEKGGDNADSFFDAQKGFGFIAVEGGGPDVFVHITAVESSGLGNLTDGQKVSFDTKMDPKKGKPNAVNIKPT